MKRHRQLTYKQRCQIEVLKRRGLSQIEIGAAVGVSQPTISRELARNTGQRGYRHKQAQRQTESRREQARKQNKMTAEMIELVEPRLQEKWSPEQNSGWLLSEQKCLLSHERIYLHVWADKRAGGNLYEYLRRNGKAYERRRNGRSCRGQIKNRVSIDERPAVVDRKSRVGDWEIDTVFGKGHRGALVTIVERKTLFTLAAPVADKSAEAVTQATIELLMPYADWVHSITADNGKKFAYHERIATALDAKVYFAHPYHSWERSLNENTNGLLRQYRPKHTELRSVSCDEVEAVIGQLNARPRKTLGYATPQKLMKKTMAAKAA